jgi:hypothetical protein
MKVTNVESTDKNSFTPLTKGWLSLHQLSQNSLPLNRDWKTSVPNVIQTRQGMQKTTKKNHILK